ncbi:DUF4908 domain-containing protein [Brevundimonas sp. 3P9-tot-E]|uniref:DUF4908 domain-containing protein n=1 Tax=Brevundimonas TaxID=41275 RepID=UPI001F33E99E|nr:MULTISPECIES: DUF4908 domain-containing protein [Brevundimonas]MDA0743579.1 DUF4908 domain-containing protein [Pseudomonadota bacterium]MDA1322905.1 DUF4908 domain-containing protein [Pseudomonadota bacterium]MDM8353907.1 DUF4908 domain-containing protein [Brevundimonas diminuta]
MTAGLTLFLACGAVAAEATAQTRSNAQAEQSRAIRDQSIIRTTPPPGRYTSEAGQSFILDQAGSLTLLRFERSTETWALRPSSAPRGDTIYRNDAGDQVLRVTTGGGITVYTTRAPGGSPVSLAGPPVSLAPPSLGPVQMFNLMARRSGLVSEAMGRLVRINLDGQESEALCIEALIVTTDAVVRIARSPSARPFLDRLRSITIIEGQRSSVTYSGGDLRVVVDPRRGIAGRPSSARVIRAVIPQD